MQAKSTARPRSLFACLTALMLLLPAAGTPADAAQHRTKTRVTRTFRPLLPSPEKDAAIVVDGATGKVIYARNPDAIRYPASLTKMMTLYLLFEALDKGTITLDTPMIASSHAAEQQPTKLYVPLGGSIPVETAIKALTVLSANDVAVVIAEALGGGSEGTFANMMTEKAHQLGMIQTNFHNASGLPDPLQITTARDMATLGRHIAYDFPQYYRYFSTTSFSYNGRTYNTHDNLLAAFDGTDGIKTGYTQLSGFNLVTSAVRDNRHVVGVVLGGPSAAVRDREMMRLLGAAFKVADESPGLLADAYVPWRGGKGPGGDLYNPKAGEVDILTAMLESKGRKGSDQTLVADARSSRGEPAVVLPMAKPANFSGEPVQTAALEPPGSRSGFFASYKAPLLQVAPPSLNPAASSVQVAQGDGAEVSAPVILPAPAPPGVVKRWAIQIGVFASETLAQAQLAEFAQRGVDLVGQAQKLVIPFSSLGGHKLYRARLGLFAEDEARDICKRMAQRGQACFVAPQA